MFTPQLPAVVSYLVLYFFERHESTNNNFEFESWRPVPSLTVMMLKIISVQSLALFIDWQVNGIRRQVVPTPDQRL